MHVYNVNMIYSNYIGYLYTNDNIYLYIMYLCLIEWWINRLINRFRLDWIGHLIGWDGTGWYRMGLLVSTNKKHPVQLPNSSFLKWSTKTHRIKMVDSRCLPLFPMNQFSRDTPPNYGFSKKHVQCWRERQSSWSGMVHPSTRFCSTSLPLALCLSDAQ